jgi:hypothetical protein
MKRMCMEKPRKVLALMTDSSAVIPYLTLQILRKEPEIL